jgi:hypothetical protein
MVKKKAGWVGWQLFESIMAAIALRKSKPKMGCVTFYW